MKHLLACLLILTFGKSDARHVATKHQLQWLDVTSDTVRNLAWTNHLVPGGRDLNEHALYICRVVYSENLQVPGKLDLANGSCIVAGLRLENTKEEAFSKYQVLVNPNPKRPYRWSSPEGDSALPLNAAPSAGLEMINATKHPFYIGRMKHSSGKLTEQDITIFTEWSNQLGRLDELGKKLTYGYAGQVYHASMRRQVFPQKSHHVKQTMPNYEVLTLPAEEEIKLFPESKVHWVTVSRENVTAIPVKRMVSLGKRISAPNPRESSRIMYICRCIDCAEKQRISGKFSFNNLGQHCFMPTIRNSGALLKVYQVMIIPDGMEYEWIRDTNGTVPWEALAQYGPTVGGSTLHRGRPAYYLAKQRGVYVGVVDPLFGNGALLGSSEEMITYNYFTATDFSVLLVKPAKGNK